MSAPPRMAVIGLGAMGRHHARILATMTDVELAAVADPDPSRLATGYARHVRHYAGAEQMFDRERLDGVVIATPTRSHAPIAKLAMERGIGVLVEKPIAASLEEGKELLKAATISGMVLAVGHVERFNPAVQELKQRLDGNEIGRIFHIRSHREGPFPPRIADVGVTVDLATHELDILGHLLGAAPELVFAQTARRLNLDHEDVLTAVLRYPGGVLATVDVNWLTPTKIRQLALSSERGLFVVDYLTQDLTWYENSEAGPGWDVLDTLHGVREGRAIRFPVRRREPLALELTAFVSAVRGEAEAAVSGSDGIRALALALRLLESASTDSPLVPPLEEAMVVPAM